MFLVIWLIWISGYLEIVEIVDSFWNALDSRYTPMLMFYYLKKDGDTVFFDTFRLLL